MPGKVPIYDAHHHLWDLNRCRYPWLKAMGVKRFFGDPAPIQRDYLAADLLEDAIDYRLVGSTHVQVGAVEEDSLEETRFVQEIADKTGNLGNAIVAYADITHTYLEEGLEQQAVSSNFRGVRQIIGRHPGEDAKTASGELLSDPAFARGLQVLSDKGLGFDLQLIEQNYASAASVFRNVPDLRFAICHFASPWDLSPEGFKRWCAAMSRFAALPGAHLKFSGFGMFKPNWSSEDIRPYVEAALDLFGEDRCMAGSNFPVDKLYGGYERVWIALSDILGTGDAYRKITLENARKYYRV